MVVYALISRQAFRRYLTYRGAMVGGVLANTVFGVIKAFIMMAVWRQRPSIGGYDVADAVTYVFLAQAMIGPMSTLNNGLDIPARIRSGDIGTDLFRPVDFQTYWLANDLGRAAFSVLGRSVVPFVIGALLFHLHLPTDPRVWAAFTVALFLGVVVSFALRYLAAMSTFWLLDEKGVVGMATVVTSFFSGMIVPLVLFPGWLGQLARLLPFAALVQLPADVFLGKRSGGAVGTGYLFEIGWAAALLLAGRLVTRRARHRVVVQGG
ncbi:ABC transporter permease [Catenulispora pinisilvae]|uniref:ABC transporter permease n=1 Tax=Catenulispora pinisilvae TaxID=2705253 RepID=UPI0018911764|nr:ABC-2 family transporter protein [Catenulispora pinisilvae]